MSDKVRNPMFQVAHKTAHGETLYTDNVLRSAMAMTFYLVHMCGITAQYTKNSDGTITVTGTALEPITYEEATK